MNILLTSVGRRAYLVKYFKEALGSGGRVFVSNSDDKSVAFHYADGYVVTILVGVCAVSAIYAYKKIRDYNVK